MDFVCEMSLHLLSAKMSFLVYILLVVSRLFIKLTFLDDRVNVDKQTCLLTVCGFYDLLNEQVVKFWAFAECFNI